MDVIELKKIANEVRKGIVTSVHSAKAGHPGGSLSAADVFTYLYFEEMNIDPADPKKADRDRFVLSKGHTAPGLYSVLAQRGYFPVEDLKTLRHIGSYLQGHPDMKHIPGVDMSSGSLGQGISAAVGMALSAKLSHDDYRVYTLLGDGEIQEGQVWEASMFAGHRKLDNLVVIVDNNGLQIDGNIADVCSPYSGTEYLAVTPWGDLYPCHQFVGQDEFLMGNVWDGVVKTDIRDEFKLCNIYAKDKCTNCFAKFYCSGGCAANSWNFHHSITDAYDVGCELMRKRVECAIMIKAAAADEEGE